MDDTRLTTILVIGALTYALRLLPQLLFVGKTFSDAADRYLRYLSYALICGIISNVLFMTGDHIATAVAPQRAIALAVTVLVAHRTKNAVMGIAVGLVLVLLLAWLR